MCGLFGFFVPGEGAIPQVLMQPGRSALECLNHRGPDQTGVQTIDNVFLGHTRLSIIDLSEAGRQPFVSHDGNVATAVNGEIYNYQPLKSRLNTARFQSDSDSEVVLHGYREWGIAELLEQIDGMYAGVIYDRQARSLYLFRDRVGVKPLYYGWAQAKGYRVFVWASELKAIVAFADPLSIDESAILDFAMQRVIPAPKSIYKGIQKLLPASFCAFECATQESSIHCYWRLHQDTLRGMEADQVFQTLPDLLDQSVKEQLVADVPVGLFLSGGMDSSVLCESVCRQAGTIDTYTIGFEDEDRDEASYAQVMADQFGTSHVLERYKRFEAQQPHQSMLTWFDEPFGDLSALPTERVSKLARTGSVVALSGDGGDELFGGYHRYNRFNRLKRFRRIAHWLGFNRIDARRPSRAFFQRMKNGMALVGQPDELHLYAGVMSNYLYTELEVLRQRLGVSAPYDYLWSLRPHYHPHLGAWKSLQYLDFHTFLPDDLLTKVDRVSMANSLEVRVPFLSRSMVEAAFKLPENLVYAGGDLKGGMKRLFEQRLPKQIVQRAKQGFSPPIQEVSKILTKHGSYVKFVVAQIDSHGLEMAIRNPKPS